MRKCDNLKKEWCKRKEEETRIKEEEEEGSLNYIGVKIITISRPVPIHFISRILPVSSTEAANGAF